MRQAGQQSTADIAVSQLRQIGYNDNEITVILKDGKWTDDQVHESGSRSMEGLGTGAAIGGTIGAVLAALLAVGTIAIPGGRVRFVAIE